MVSQDGAMLCFVTVLVAARVDGEEIELHSGAMGG